MTASRFNLRYWNDISKVMVYNPSIRKDYKLGLNTYISDDRGWMWMQSLGITDKNGKEVFEGDKINFKGIEYVAEYNDYCYLLVPIEKDKYGSKISPRISQVYAAKISIGGVIIGNIYEDRQCKE